MCPPIYPGPPLPAPPLPIPQPRPPPPARPPPPPSPPSPNPPPPRSPPSSLLRPRRLYLPFVPPRLAQRGPYLWHSCYAFRGKRFEVQRDDKLVKVGGDELTTSEVKKHIIEPTCKTINSCYADQLPPKEVWGHAGRNGGVQFVYIIHAWGNAFKLLVDSLLKRFPVETDRASTYVWIDLFAGARLSMTCNLPHDRSPCRTTPHYAALRPLTPRPVWFGPQCIWQRNGRRVSTRQNLSSTSPAPRSLC